MIPERIEIFTRDSLLEPRQEYPNTLSNGLPAESVI